MKRVNPVLAPPPSFMEDEAAAMAAATVIFKGWARRAVAVEALEVTEVKRPNLGEKVSNRCSRSAAADSRDAG